VDVIRALVIQGLQMVLVLALAPLLTGIIRKVKARLLRRRGPPVIQPYRDLLRLLRKEVVLAGNASWLFRATPYLIFATTWVAAALVPTFATGLASLAEPATLMNVFTLALVAGSTQLSTIAAVFDSGVGLRVSLGLALVALVMVAIAENGRVPIDNPATHLELTMVHEAMVLEYSGRHLALLELAAALKLLFYLSLIACLFAPWGLAGPDAGAVDLLLGLAGYLFKVITGGFLLAGFETSIAKMRVFRVPVFLGASLMLGFLGTLLLFVTRSI
jgi:formate hydrogenlyase subunit 4